MSVESPSVGKKRERIAPERLERLELARERVSEELIREFISVLLDAFQGRWPIIDPGVPLEDHVAWKLSSPCAEPPAYGTRVDGELASVTFVIAFPMLVQNQRRLRYQAVDHCVATAWQGRGLSSYRWNLVAKPSASPYDLSIGDSQNPRFAHRLRDLGYRFIDNSVRPLLRVIDGGALAEELRSHYRFAPLRFGATAAAQGLERWGKARSRLSPVPPGELRLRTADRLGAGFDAFWDEVAASFDFITIRDSTYISWRYLDRRAGPFVVRLAEERGRIVGYSVLRPTPNRGYLADLLALPDRLDVVDRLADDAVRRLTADGCSAVWLWLPEKHPYRRTLRRRGFWARGRHIPITVCPIRMPVEELDFLCRPGARVHFMQGDTDQI